MTDHQGMSFQQMVYPCIFYRMANFECALCRYGLGLCIRDAITKTIESVLRGVIHKRKDLEPKNGPELARLAQYIEKTFITEGLEHPVEPISCFGLLKIGAQYVCGPHNLWFDPRFQEVIPFLLESSEGTYGCLCYLAALATRELTRKSI